MHTKHMIRLTTLLSFALLLLSLRHHIRDFGECVRTYATFHPYLARHPDVLLQLPSPADSSTQENVGLSKPVPKIIHQIFLAKGDYNASLETYAPAIASCKALHPTWEFYLWTDDNATVFMNDFYPEIAPHFETYAQTIQRANVLRYAVLHHYGGVYLDLDVTCRAAFDAKLPPGSRVPTLAHVPWLTPGAHPAGINNAFILTRPQHRFLTHVLSRLPSRDMVWGSPYVENMLSTGCMFISNAWMEYARQLRRASEIRKEDMVYVLADENGHLESHMLRGKVETILFAHAGASSWHGWDAAMILVLGRFYHYLFYVLIGSAVVGVSIYWGLKTRGRSAGPHARHRPLRATMAHYLGLQRPDQTDLLADEEEMLDKSH